MAIKGVNKEEEEVAQLRAKIAWYEKNIPDLLVIKEELKKIRLDVQSVLDKNKMKKVLEGIVSQKNYD